MAGGTKVILDNNLWSRIGEEDGAARFSAALTDRGFTAVLLPSILIEVMQTPNADTRRRIVDAMLAPRGLRLASEAELSADEFVAVLRRFRPEWLRSMPDTAAVDSWHTFWTKRVWRAAREQSEQFHQSVLKRPSVAAVEDWFQTQLLNQDAMRTTNFGGDFIDVLLGCSPEEGSAVMGGWDGSYTPMWRVLIGDYYWRTMARPASRVETQREWFAAYIDLRTALSDAESFRKLWFEELEPRDVQREWLRRAVGHAQLVRKVKKSNALDAQHTMYLVDADLFLSADSAFIEVLKDVRRQVPFALAEPRRVTHANSWTDSTIAALESPPRLTPGGAVGPNRLDFVHTSGSPQ